MYPEGCYWTVNSKARKMTRVSRRLRKGRDKVSHNKRPRDLTEFVPRTLPEYDSKALNYDPRFLMRLQTANASFLLAT